MSGILANSASKTMVAGDTSADNSVSGFVSAEQITLSVTGTPVSTSWGIAKPSDSGARTDLSSSTDASPTFTPDVAGYYTITCVVDGVTAYVIRLAVAAASAVSTLTAIRMLPVTDASVPTPATGVVVYYSSDAGALVEKKTDGTVHTITVT